MGQLVTDLFIVCVADHIVVEKLTAHAGQLNVAGLQGPLPPFSKRSAPWLISSRTSRFSINLPDSNVREGSKRQVWGLRIPSDDTGFRSGRTGKGFHVDLLDRVVSLIELSVDNSVEWECAWASAQSPLATKAVASFLSLLTRSGGGCRNFKRKIPIQVSGLLISVILGSLERDPCQ